MREIEGDIMLHTGPGGHRCDCGHAPDVQAYFIRLHLYRNDGIRYRFDVCSLACLRRVCEQKNIQVVLTGSGYIPVHPYSVQRKRIEE